MPDHESAGTSGEAPGAPSVDEVLARLRGLIESKPAERGYPLEWAVSAYFLGDMSALTTLSLSSGD